MKNLGKKGLYNRKQKVIYRDEARFQVYKFGSKKSDTKGQNVE